jgi:hypothetical protein
LRDRGADREHEKQRGAKRFPHGHPPDTSRFAGFGIACMLAEVARPRPSLLIPLMPGDSF